VRYIPPIDVDGDARDAKAVDTRPQLLRYGGVIAPDGTAVLRRLYQHGPDPVAVAARLRGSLSLEK
jgi:hypothetical protein